jgi:hypothetical protein
MSSGGMVYIPSLMKIGKGAEGILRFCISNLKGCNVGITEGQDFCGAPLKWAQVA